MNPESRKKIGPALAVYLARARPYDLADVNILVAGRPADPFLETSTSEMARPKGDAPADRAAERSRIVAEMKTYSFERQARLVDFLQEASRTIGFSKGPITRPPARGVKQFWMANVVSAEVSPETLSDILDLPEVEFVDLASDVSLDRLFDEQAPLDNPVMTAANEGPSAMLNAPIPTRSVEFIGAPMLWDLGIDGTGILVAVVDSGVNYRHPDLAARMWDGRPAFPNHGYNFAEGNYDPDDRDDHGTAAAGIVAGDGTFGKITGVAPGASVMALRVGNEQNCWDAFQFAAEHGADVISMSVTLSPQGRPSYQIWRRKCEGLLVAGIAHANSAGNHGDECDTHSIPHNVGTPADCPPPWLHPEQVIVGGVSSSVAVGAATMYYELLGTSSRGPVAWNGPSPNGDYPYDAVSRMGLIKPDLCAPGYGTISCNSRVVLGKPSTVYRPFDMTSAAAPHVGGCFALLAHACMRTGTPVVPARFQRALEETARRLEGQTRAKENGFGAGIVDVYQAFLYGCQQGWW